MKKIISVVAVSMVAVMLFAGCGNSGSTETSSAAAADSASTAVESVSAASAPDADLSDIYKTIDFGDYEGIQALMKEMSNFEIDGKVVTIEGEFDSDTSSYGILESDGNGNLLGCTIVVDGLDDSNAPEDGAKIKVTGVVSEGANALSRVIRVAAENFEVIE